MNVAPSARNSEYYFKHYRKDMGERKRERVSERKRVKQREARIENGKVGERKAYIYTKTGGERKRGLDDY